MPELWLDDSDLQAETQVHLFVTANVLAVQSSFAECGVLHMSCPHPAYSAYNT